MSTKWGTPPKGCSLFCAFFALEEKMRVNGENVCLDKSISLYDFLIAQGHNIAIIAVVMNGEIVPKANYQSSFVDDETTLEVVRFVGGG